MIEPIKRLPMEPSHTLIFQLTLIGSAVVLITFGQVIRSQSNVRSVAERSTNYYASKSNSFYKIHLKFNSGNELS